MVKDAASVPKKNETVPPTKAPPSAVGSSSSAVDGDKKSSSSSTSSSKALHAPIAVAVLVAISSIYIAQRFPGGDGGSVFQTTRSLLPVLSMQGPKSSSSSSKGQGEDPHLAASKKAFNIAIPTARLTGSPSPREEIPYYRPNVLTDSINPPVTPPHGTDRIGLFLYQNGFSADPVPALVSTAELCYSADTIMTTLSRMAENYGCDGKCRVFLHNGWEVTSCEEIQENDKLWLVRPGKEFMWPTFEVGHLVEVRHVSTANREPIIVETLSKSPKVFKLNNFFTASEADELINYALTLTDPANKLKRSTTGQGEKMQEDTHRTSENAWDLSSPTATKLKKRIFELLGVRPYLNDWADGMQTLRYQSLQAYNSHHDYLEFKEGGRLDSANGGANRYATVVVYLSDVEEGGETVFPEGERLGPPVSEAQARAELAKIVEEEGLNVTSGSWEERLILQCRTRLAVKPKKAEAVLFYSQDADGRLDDAALHGGCPVLKGTKWASNLWVWNGPVHGNDNDVTTTTTTKESMPSNNVIAHFSTTVPGYSLYWKETFFGRMEPGKEIRMNTFPHHEFRVYEGDEEERGELVETFEIGEATGDDQYFVFEGDE